MTAIEERERVIDFKRLKKIFSNDTSIMEQVMHGLIITAHQKAPDLERFYKAGRWDDLKSTIDFIQSAYQHVGTDLLKDAIYRLVELIGKREFSTELSQAITHMKSLSKNMIQDIEYYLAN